MHHPIDRITHTTSFVTTYHSRGTLAGTRNTKLGTGVLRHDVNGLVDNSQTARY